jgi:3',5'-cyclic AMP phosphodiesterase CpdA
MFPFLYKIILIVQTAYSFGSFCPLAGHDLGLSPLEFMEAQKVSLANESIFGSKKRGERLGKKRPKVAKIAIVGDQGLGSNSRKVLQMVSDFGADLLLIPGDFDYQDSPSSFMHQITDVLGKSFPVIAAPGNHDILMWFSEHGYRDLLLKQAARSGLKRHCFGDYGINSACLLGDVLIVQSGVGTLGTDHASWIDKTFARYWDVPWKICMWHKNQKNLQTGDKQVRLLFVLYSHRSTHLRTRLAI